MEIDEKGISDIQSLEKWADIVIERWETRIVKLNIINTGTLLKSFTRQVFADAAGNPSKVSFTFAYYGRFVDAGVGRGVRAGKVPQSHRQPRPWYSKLFIGECNKLAEIFAKRYSEIGAKTFKIIENNRRVV